MAEQMEPKTTRAELKTTRVELMVRIPTRQIRQSWNIEHREVNNCLSGHNRTGRKFRNCIFGRNRLSREFRGSPFDRGWIVSKDKEFTSGHPCLKRS